MIEIAINIDKCLCIYTYGYQDDTLNKSRTPLRCKSLSGDYSRNKALAETITTTSAMNVLNHGKEDTGLAVQNQTTIFVEDGNVKESSIQETVIHDDLVIRDQSIADFMRKPQLVSVLNWTTASAASADLTSFSISTTLLANTVWTNKIAGFNLVRGTAVIRVQLNANPFQQGKLYVQYIPNYAQRGDSARYRLNLAVKRQLPGVELDCRESTAILRIPFISPHNFYNIKSGFFDWGTVFVTVLSPLVTGSGGTGNVDISVYMSFDDFELSAPSIPQGPTSGKRVIGRSFKNAPTDAEVAAVSDKPVSQALSTISTVTDSLSEIPVIGSMMGTVSWAADAASKVAGFLGWSKPTIQSSPQIMVRQFNRYMPNNDGADVSYKMSLSSTNKINVSDDICPTHYDEMSFDYLKQVSSVFKSVTWNASDAIGASLLHDSIGPRAMSVSGTVVHGGHTATYETGNPVYYLNNIFKEWRGSIRLILKIVKTDYHTGRLMINWTPFLNAGSQITAPVYNGNSQYSLRHIVDLREGSEICLDLPYLASTNYILGTEYSGQLDIQVINQLRAPETCAQNVQLLFYYSGGEDFEFAVPGTSNAQPFYPQIGELDCQQIGGGRRKQDITLYPTLSMGEKFTSIRQLIARASRFYKSTADVYDASFYLYPWFTTIGSINAVSGVLVPPILGGDNYCYLAPLYAFFRGSMRIQIVGDGVKPIFLINNPLVASATYYGQATGVGTNINLTLGAVGSTPYLNNAVAVQDGVTQMSVAEAPYYCKARCSINEVIFTGTNSIDDNASTNPASILNFAQADNANTCFYRSCGEDFQLCFFLGCPPLLVSYT